MLDIYTSTGWLPINEYKEYYTDYEYDGTQTLCFDVPGDSELLQYMKNEVPIRNNENLYLIKTVNKRKTQCSINCELNLDDWKNEKPYINTKEDSAFVNKTLLQLLEYIKPNGWNILNASISTTKYTPELNDATQYEVLFALQEFFKVTYEFDCLTKQIYVINPESRIDKGLYITPQLNLDNIEWKGTSSGFCTRLYAYGKNNLSFASINNGKDYLENMDYTNKQVSLTWRDDRCEDKEILLKNAKEKLREMAIPNIAYTATVNDLAKIDDNYKFLEFQLYDKAHTIIDENTSILQTIVKYRKYHNAPEKNNVTLSSEAQKITSKIDKVSSILGDNGDKLFSSLLQQAQEETTQLIKSFAEKGNIYQTQNEIYILDRLPKELAKYVCRINLGGIAFSQNGVDGPYITAWTITGKFNAEFITTGILQGIKIICNSGIIGGLDVNNDGLSYTLENATFDDPEVTGLVKGIFNFYIKKTGPRDNFIGWKFTTKGDSHLPDGTVTLNTGFSSFGMTGVMRISAKSISAMAIDCAISSIGQINCDSISVTGTKNRVVKTNNFGVIKLNALEATNCLFEDNGSGVLNNEGECILFFDPVYLETINTKTGYYVQLTKCGLGDLYVYKKYDDYFIVRGTSHLTFDWCVKGIQKGYENERMTSGEIRIIDEVSIENEEASQELNNTSLYESEEAK